MNFRVGDSMLHVASLVLHFATQMFSETFISHTLHTHFDVDLDTYLCVIMYENYADLPPELFRILNNPS